MVAPIIYGSILAVLCAVALYVLVGTNTIETIYYKDMPEVEYGRLLATHQLTDAVIQKTLDEKTGTVFRNVLDYPVSWEDAESADEDELLSLYDDGLKLATSSYFDSVENIQTETLDVEVLGSSLEYGTNGLLWTFDYNIKMTNLVTYSGGGLLNSIDSKGTYTKELPLVDLRGARNCGKAFFDELNVPAGVPVKGMRSEKLATYLNQEFAKLALNANSEAECSGFELSAEIWGSPGCGGEDCSKSVMPEVQVVLSVSDPTGELVGVSFLGDVPEDFFSDGQVSSGFGECTVGADCTSEDCVFGICGDCSAIFAGQVCSPQGSSNSQNNYRCYETSLGDYDCLPYIGGIRVSDGSTQYSDESVIRVNCVDGSETDFAVVDGSSGEWIDDVEVYLGGIELRGTNSKFDLCDSDLPRINGPLEVYVPGGVDKYCVLSAYVSYYLDDCISGFTRHLDGYVVSVGDGVEVEDLKATLTSEIERMGSDCGNYEVALESLERSCDDECPAKVTWGTDKYSILTLTFSEGTFSTRQNYIISYMQ